MRATWCTSIVAFTLCACSAQSQTSRPINERDCPSGAAPVACRSFSELRKAHDAKLETALKNDAYVCFEPKRDEFYVVYFDFPIALEMASPKSEPGPYDGAGYLEMRDYRSGVFAPDGRSKTIFGYWSKHGDNYKFESNGLRANEEPPVSAASVDGESVTVKQEFKNTAGEQTYFSIAIQRSTGRFDINYQYVLGDRRRDIEAVQGRCLPFKRH